MQSLTFNSSSPYMVYSNYPEGIQGYATGDHYTTSASITVYQNYTVFFYHLNISSLTKRIGVAIKNTGSSNLTVTYYGGGMLSGGDPLDNCATLASYCVNSSNGTSLRSVSNLAPGSSAFLVYNDVPTQYYSVGKFIFRTNQSASIRIFHGPTSLYAGDVFSLTQDGYSDYDGDDTRVAAAGIQSLKTVASAIDCSTNPTFKLFEYPIAYNSNEYQSYTTFLNRNPYSSQILWGNYEQTYTLNFSNPSGKTLRLTPYGYPARIMTYTSSTGVWTLQPKISSGYFSVPLGSSSSAIVKIILCGSNYGNFTGSIV